MDNPIDQNLHIDLSIYDIKIEFEDNKIKFYKNKYPHRYADNKEKILLGKLNYYDSIQELNDKSRNENDLVSFEDFISNDIEYIMDKEKFDRKRDSILQKNIINNLIDSDGIKAQITSTTVKDNDNIVLYIEADNIIHEKNLEYTFENPMEENSLFLRFIDYMEIKSLDELELQPIMLSKKPDIINITVENWNINKCVETEQDNMQQKGLINQIVSLIT